MDNKIIVLLKATGNAPILKQSKFKISATQQFHAVIDFMKKQLRLPQGESLVLKKDLD